MTIRDRLLRCIRLEVTDRVPVNYLVGKGEKSQRVLDYFGAENHPALIRKLGIDGMDPWGWALVEPDYLGSGPEQAINSNVTFSSWRYDSAYSTPMEDCDTEKLLMSYRYPRVEDFDFSHMEDRLKSVINQDNLSFFGPVSVGFLHHVRMRGYDRVFPDLLNESWMSRYNERVLQFYEVFLPKLIQASAGKLDVIHMDEDVGSNDRLMISPVMWRKFYKPNWKAVCDNIKKNGIAIWMHSCGYCRDIIEDFIELGIDILAPGGGFMIQPSQGLTEDMPMQNIERFFTAALQHGNY